MVLQDKTKLPYLQAYPEFNITHYRIECQMVMIAKGIPYERSMVRQNLIDIPDQPFCVVTVRDITHHQKAKEKDEGHVSGDLVAVEPVENIDETDEVPWQAGLLSALRRRGFRRLFDGRRIL